MKIIYVKCSTQRNEQYKIMTTIYQNAENYIFVRKEPVGISAHLHMDQINSNAMQIMHHQDVFEVPAVSYSNHIFETEYIPGDTLEKELYLLIIQKRYEEFENGWMYYKSLLEKMPNTECNPSENEAFRSMFGQTDRVYSCMKLGHIDLITENIIHSPDGKLWNIDPEWIIDAPIPIEFILYRAVVIFYNKFQSLLSMKYTVDDLHDLMGIQVDRELFSKWEEKFSQRIYNNSIFEIQKKYFAPTPDFTRWSSHIPDVFVSTLYYGTDFEFSSDCCLHAEIRRDRKIELSFSFSGPQVIQSLRWDPCNGAFPVMTSCSVELKLKGQSVGIIDTFKTNAVLLKNAYIFLTTDPQVLISLPQETAVDEVVIHAALEILVYHDLEAKILAPANQLIASQLQENQTLQEQKQILQEQKQLLQEQKQLLQEEISKSIDYFSHVNNDLQRSMEQMQNSLSWKLTTPFRALINVLRVIKNPLTNTRSLKLSCVSAMIRTPVGTYQVTGEDPQFLIERKFRKGIYLFTWDGSATKRTQMKLFLDYGRGFNEIDSQVLGYVNQEFSRHERFLRLKRDVSRMRLDPSENGSNTIGLVNFHYVRLGIFQGIRIGIALISKKTGFNKIRLFGHFVKLFIQGRKYEAASHFASVFKDHGDGQIAGDDVEAYHQYIHECEPDIIQINEQIRQVKSFLLQPLISVVVPVYNTNRQMLIDMIESVREQTYGKWELCLADGHSSKEYVAEVLKEYAAKDKRIKITLLEENYGIVGNSNAALELASGEYISLLDHDDLLPPWALYSVVTAINKNDSPDILYSDEDKISFDGARRFSPHFKPDWSPYLLRSCNYITHLFTAKRDLINRVGKFQPGFDGSQDFDLILRATEQANKIVHIPEILYHWRSHSESTAESAGNKMYAYEAGIRAITAHLQRIGYEGSVINSRYLGFYTINYKLTAEPLVSIIIPNYEHLADLRRCLTSIYKLSTYKNFEIIIVENNSTSKEIFAYYNQMKHTHRVSIVKWEGEFNYSAINNYAVQFAKGEILLFLNNDTEVIVPDWIEQMLQYAQLKDVGAVGAKLYYADDSIQHGGVILGFQGIAGHAFSRLPKSNPGYMGRGIVVQNVSSVTAACMMMSKKLFEELEGFDESFKIAFNDIDLCLKIRQTGKLIVFNPNAELYHHESISRGAEETKKKMERFASEIEYFSTKWKDQLAAGDPYYNPHLDLEHTPYRISGK